MNRTDLHWRIGTMGFSYAKDWRGSFYPPDLKPDQFLSFYARQFDTVEMDTTAYGIPTPDRVAGWRAAVPDDFRFTLKAPRAITHEPDMAAKADLLRAFGDSLDPMRSKLASIVLQLPPTAGVEVRDDLHRLLDGVGDGLPLAVEVRHQSWFDGRSLPGLQTRGVTVIANDLHDRAQPIVGPGAMIYVRLKGVHKQFSANDREQLDVAEREAWWVERVEAAAGPGATAIVIVANDYSGFSPANVRRLRALVRLPDTTPTPGSAEAGSLF